MLVQVLVLSDSLIILLYAVETHFSADYFLGASQVAQVNICEDSCVFTRSTAFHAKFSYGNALATIAVSDVRPHASDFSSRDLQSL